MTRMTCRFNKEYEQYPHSKYGYFFDEVSNGDMDFEKTVSLIEEGKTTAFSLSEEKQQDYSFLAIKGYPFIRRGFSEVLFKDTRQYRQLSNLYNERYPIIKQETT